MRHWQTGDEATDSNLQYLGSLGIYWETMRPQDFMDKIHGLIELEQMLPAAVMKHFIWPRMYVGAGPYEWSRAQFVEEAKRLTDAINSGLERAALDETLRRRGGVDLSDRPRSKGEQILAALKGLEERRDQSRMDALRKAARGAPFHYELRAIEQAMNRLRPARGTSSIEETVFRAIYDLRAKASRYHHVKANN